MMNVSIKKCKIFQKHLFRNTLLQMALLWESNLMSRNSDFTLNALEMSRVASPNRCSLISHTKVSHKDLSGGGSTTPPSYWGGHLVWEIGEQLATSGRASN